MAYQKKTSPWVYVGIGCGVILVVGLIFLAVAGFLGYRFVQSVERGLTDPEVKEARARDLLNVEQLPEGYNTLLSISIPLAMDLVVLSDKEPDAAGRIEGFTEKGFVYARVAALGNQRAELLEFLEGRNEDWDVLMQGGVDFERHEFLGRGRFDLQGNEVVYASFRGDIEVERERLGGIVTLFTIDCPGSGRIHLGLWFGSDPGTGNEVELPDLSGTPADEATLLPFLDQFRFCGG
jgi:hypothetical protein